MGYIGNEPITGHFPVQTNLVGPGPTYPLTQTPASAGAIEVSVSGVLQPTTAYSVNGTTLTMAGVGTGVPIFIRYLGETLSIPVPGDGTVTDIKIADMSATKLTGTIDNARISLDAAEIPNLDTTKVTTGTFHIDRISQASVTQHVAAIDLTAVRQDIAMLALYNAVSDNRSAYNLPHSFIDQFEDDTGVTTKTDVSNVTEYFASVTGSTGSEVMCLLHCDGANDGITFTDVGPNAHAITRYASAHTDTTIKKWGSASLQFPGSGYLAMPSHSDWTLGTSDFSCDFWIYLNATGVQLILGNSVSGMNQTNWRFYTNAGKINFGSSQAHHYAGTTVLSTGAWYHYAFQKEGTDMRAWINGTSDATGETGSHTHNFSTTDYLWIGRSVDVSAVSNFYLDEIRLCKGGTAKYDTSSSTITVPTDAYGLVIGPTGTLVSDVQTAPVATTKMSGVILYKDAYDPATLGTQLKIYLTANLQGTSPNWTGTDWKEVVAGDFGAVTSLFSTGVKMVRIAEQTVVSGTACAMKAVWASQASGTMETQLHGWAMNY